MGQFDSVIIDDHIIHINMTLWISKAYSWTHNPQLLYYIINENYKKNTGQQVIFEFGDGENLFFSGASEFIRYCQTTLEIPKEDLFIKSLNTCQLDYATHITIHSGFLGIQKWNFEIKNHEFDKKFLSLSGRFDLNRLRLTMHLHSKWRNDAIISYFLNLDHVKHNLRGREHFFPNELAWVKENAPMWIDGINAINDMLKISVSWEQSMQELSLYYNKYFIDIVSETDPWNPKWITEKTVRSFIFGKPFILFSGCRALEYLKTLGFQTFSPWINESYDQIENPELRLCAIMREIDRIGHIGYPELHQWAEEMQPIFEHNKENQKKYQNNLGSVKF